MRRETKGRIGLGFLVAALIGTTVWSREHKKDEILSEIEEAKKTPIEVGLREVYWSPSSEGKLFLRGLVYKGLIVDKFAISNPRGHVDFYPLSTKEFEMDNHRYGVLDATEDSLKLSYIGPVEK